MTLQEWFEKGTTYGQYRNSMEVNGAEVDRVYEQVTFTDDDKARFSEWKSRDWKGVVLTADWCGDAALNVPLIQRIAEQSGFELRYLIRDENLELMDQYLTNGTARAIPIFIFIDGNGNETAVWGPRSSEVQELVTSMRAGLPSPDSPDFAEKQQTMYKEFRERITTDPSVWRSVIDSVIQKLK